MLVPTKRTQPTMLDFAKAIMATHHDLTKAQAGVLFAQFAAETADGLHCYNHNLGNVKWTPGSGLDHMALVGVWECFPAAKAHELIASGQAVADPSPHHACADGCESVVFSKENPITWFRAYPDLETGMRAFVAMKCSGRFKTAWPFVLRADVEGFARDLGTVYVRPGDKTATAYYTASITAYAAALRAKLDRWMASDAWEKASAEIAPGSHVSTTPVELVQEGCAAVEPVSGDCAAFVPLLDFEIVHATPLPDRPEREV